MLDHEERRFVRRGKIAVAAVGLVAAVVAGVGFYFVLSRDSAAKDGANPSCSSTMDGVIPEKPFLCPAGDLNGDGLSDMVIYLEDGRTVPLYGRGKREDGSPAGYSPADLTKGQSPESPVDFEGMDKLLLNMQ